MVRPDVEPMEAVAGVERNAQVLPLASTQVRVVQLDQSQQTVTTRDRKLVNEVPCRTLVVSSSYSTCPATIEALYR